MAAVIAVILIVIFAAIWVSIPDRETKGNTSFNKDSFDEDAWRNFDIHHDSDNKVIPVDFLAGKYNNINFSGNSKKNGGKKDV